MISAQLKGRRIGRETEPKIEATLIKRLDGSRWQALVKPAKKLAPGDIVRFGNEGKVCLLGHLDAEVEAKGEEGEITLSFSFHGPALDQAIADLGTPPLPPYIASKRTPDDRDAADYQTMFAANEGAVAAPTAGLHFTPELEAALRGRGVELHRLTLHVGAGTFLPVKVEETSEHRMHAEWGSISADTADALNAARAKGGRIIAVGTTSLRLLESAATEDGTIQPFDGETSIFITPGYRFRAVDILMTNFHLPRSTLFMLVSAFSGSTRCSAPMRMRLRRGTGSIPTAMPACCFAGRIEAKAGRLAAVPLSTNNRSTLKKKPASAAGKGSGRKRSDNKAPISVSSIRPLPPRSYNYRLPRISRVLLHRCHHARALHAPALLYLDDEVPTHSPSDRVRAIIWRTS